MIYTDFAPVVLVENYLDFLYTSGIDLDARKRTPAECRLCKQFLAARNLGRKAKAMMIFQPITLCIVVPPRSHGPSNWVKVNKDGFNLVPLQFTPFKKNWSDLLMKTQSLLWKKDQALLNSDAMAQKAKAAANTLDAVGLTREAAFISRTMGSFDDFGCAATAANSFDASRPGLVNSQSLPGLEVSELDRESVSELFESGTFSR